MLLGDGFKAAQQAAFDAACNAFLAAFRATPPVRPADQRDQRLPGERAVDRLRRGRSRIGRGHRRDGANVLRRVLRRERDPPAAGVQRLHGPADRSRTGSGVHGGARRRELDDLRRERRVDRHLLARERRDRDRDPRDGTHGVRARRRVPVLRRRQRDRSRPLQRWRAIRAERDRKLQPRNAQVALGGRGGDSRIPTMRNPTCSQVDDRPSPVPKGTPGAFEGAYYFHCGAFRPEYDCKMRNLGVPFCAICREVIRNRIGPLVALHGPRPNADHRRRAQLDATRRLRSRERRANHDRLVGPAERLGRVAPDLRRRGVTGRHRLADHGRRAHAGAPRRVHGRHRQPRLHGMVASVHRLVRLGPHREHALQARLDRQRRVPQRGPSRPVHHGLEWPDDVDALGLQHGVGLVVPGSGRGVRDGSAGHRDRPQPDAHGHLHGRDRQQGLHRVVGQRVRMAWLGPPGNPRLPPRLDRDRRGAHARPHGPVHDGRGREDHVDLVGCERRLGILGPGRGRRRLARVARHARSRALRARSTCSCSGRTIASTAPGGANRPAGRTGLSWRAASASPEDRSQRSREPPITSTCSPSPRMGSSTARRGARRPAGRRGSGSGSRRGGWISAQSRHRLWWLVVLVRSNVCSRRWMGWSDEALARAREACRREIRVDLCAEDARIAAAGDGARA